MRKFLILILLLVLLALGYLGYAHFSGGAVPTFGLPLGGERAIIRERITTFFEHVKFKNTSALKNFVSPDTSEDQISAFLSKTLGQDEDNVDLLETKIDQVEIDSSKERARARITLEGTDLAKKQPLDISKVIFLFLANGEWLMDIKNVSP